MDFRGLKALGEKRRSQERRFQVWLLFGVLTSCTGMPRPQGEPPPHPPPGHTRPPSGAPEGDPTHENEQKPTTCWLQNTCLKNKAAERSRVKKEKVSHANTTQKKEGFTTQLENEATLTLKGGKKSPEIRRPILS
uniref:Uncharacterized protein n=1 Tax=Rousettus aegyptiacus TaxID=9407 RepID=A0A7J8FIP1_ROUAE|nr:hypothetical protein HJG63_011882 [Rousettus aegyptiacus]